MSEFLRANQEIVSPTIQWVGLLVLLAIILSPFLIIRYPKFRPTRWWHIVGAYFGSLLIACSLSSVILLLSQSDKISLYQFFLSTLVTPVVYSWFLLVLAYPLLLFYSSALLYGRFTRLQFIITVVFAAVFLAILFRAMEYLAVFGFAYALHSFFMGG